VVSVDQLPRTPSGKIRKAMVRDEIAPGFT
jgi:acyl-coenzyme A synthetase/AMP-(fatty) acid ligase